MLREKVSVGFQSCTSGRLTLCADRVTWAAPVPGPPCPHHLHHMPQASSRLCTSANKRVHTHIHIHTCAHAHPACFWINDRESEPSLPCGLDRTVQCWCGITPSSGYPCSGEQHGITRGAFPNACARPPHVQTRPARTQLNKSLQVILTCHTPWLLQICHVQLQPRTGFRSSPCPMAPKHITFGIGAHVPPSPWDIRPCAPLPSPRTKHRQEIPS